MSPEADTLKELPFEYWHSIVIFLKSEGYQVFLNAMNSKYDLLDVTQTKELSYQEAVELCSQSDLLLGCVAVLWSLLCLMVPQSDRHLQQLPRYMCDETYSKASLEWIHLKENADL